MYFTTDSVVYASVFPLWFLQIYIKCGKRPPKENIMKLTKNVTAGSRIGDTHMNNLSDMMEIKER